MSRDDLGDRMKQFEAVETSRKFDKNFPVYARIDGRSFSNFTRSMIRPYDERMTQCMIDTTSYLVENTHAAIGFCQSDEISLVWSNKYEASSYMFDGKIQKLCSILASMAAARFAVAYYEQFKEISYKFPHFDCRVIQLPSKIEAANMMLWRENDARKNAVSMVAHCEFSHADLQNKSTVKMREMLLSSGIDLDSWNTSFTRGTWLRRKSIIRSLTSDEFYAIPEMHRPPINTTVERSITSEMAMPPFNTVTNRVEVIFNNADPIVGE